MKKVEKEFERINAIIERRWERALGLANAEALMSYWSVGAFVSARLKSSAWGSKTVEELSDYLKTRNPRRRGFGKRQIYNMVSFYEAYTSVDFHKISERLRLHEFVQLPTAQIGTTAIDQSEKKQALVNEGIVQLPTAQLFDNECDCADFPLFLSLTTFTNHVEILNHVRSMEERVFYVLYAARERLNQMELRRAFVAQTYDMIMSKEKKMSARLKAAYPKADFVLKDKAFLDFLNLPKKHTEHVLHKRLVEHMRDFVLEIGKDFLYMGNEYFVHVGGETRREGENPSVGIILCPDADRCRVEYTLCRTMSPVLVAEYRRLLVPENVMKKSLEEYCAFMKQEELTRKG